MDSQGQTILLVEDEPQIRKFLRISLQAQGYRLIEADTGRSGIERCAAEQPALMILDLGLPDMDGQDVIRAVREWSGVPIIVLSVRSGEGEKVLALDNGANDYVTKPFGTAELLARIRALLRQHPEGEPAASEIQVGGLHIDIPARRVTVDGQEIKLTRKEFEILKMLAQNAGRIITHQHMLRELWGPAQTGETHYLRIYIRQLRHKLGDDPANPKYIENEPGVGYRMVPSGA